MKRFIWVVFSVVICIQAAGCAGWVVRTEEVRKPRVDQKITGNRGFISGRPKSGPKEPTFTERKTYRIEVEIPQWKRKKKLTPTEKKKLKKDQVLWGNRGYIFGGPGKDVVEEPRIEKSVITKVKEKISQILEPRAEKTTPMRTYKVKKGDTLEKISRKFYGTTEKWMVLYKANRDQLKGPDKVYPGQILVIPEVDDFSK